jgi:hypothetical protein
MSYCLRLFLASLKNRQRETYRGACVLNLKNRRFFKFKTRAPLKIPLKAIFEQSEKEPVMDNVTELSALCRKYPLTTAFKAGD